MNKYPKRLVFLRTYYGKILLKTLIYLSVQGLESTSWIQVLVKANHIIRSKSFILRFLICDIIST